MSGTNQIGYQFNSPGAAGRAEIALATEGIEVICCDSSQNVRIGGGTASYKLDVDGDINARTGHVYRVNGTQVVAAQVVDANLADTAALTAQTLTDNSGGSASDTIAAIGATYSQSEVANAIASLADEINKLRADNVAQKTALDAALTLIRTHGLGATS